MIMIWVHHNMIITDPLAAISSDVRRGDNTIETLLSLDFNTYAYHIQERLLHSIHSKR